MSAVSGCVAAASTAVRIACRRSRCWRESDGGAGDCASSEPPLQRHTETTIAISRAVMRMLLGSFSCLNRLPQVHFDADFSHRLYVSHHLHLSLYGARPAFFCVR